MLRPMWSIMRLLIKKNITHVMKKKTSLSDLLQKKNLINMDTLSVFSSFIKKKKKDFPLNNKKTIDKWKNYLNKKYFLKNTIISLLNGIT